jgi:hypothetical protein
MVSFPEIPGANELLQWFSGDPSFHDGEVLVHLDRSATSGTRIVTAYKPVIVRFKVEDGADLELADFSCQNVISDLGLEKRDGIFRLTMYPCYGVAGFVDARRVSVELAPRA